MTVRRRRRKRGKEGGRNGRPRLRAPHGCKEGGLERVDVGNVERVASEGCKGTDDVGRAAKELPYTGWKVKEQRLAATLCGEPTIGPE